MGAYRPSVIPTALRDLWSVIAVLRVSFLTLLRLHALCWKKTCTTTRKDDDSEDFPTYANCEKNNLVFLLKRHILETVSPGY